jgi:hypothetical protein
MHRLIQTAKLNGVDQRAWLADVMVRTPTGLATTPWEMKLLNGLLAALRG